MIDSALPSDLVTQPTNTPRRVLKMVHNERTAGSMPAWVTASEAEKIEQNLQGRSTIETHTESTLAFQDSTMPQNTQKEFTFGDLLDMINPLQHIPLVNTIYRDLTGDTIRPVSKIIGGVVFGGPAGAATGLANMIIEHETGTDIAGNALALVKDKRTSSHPERNLNLAAKAVEQNSYGDLPGELLSFADLGGQKSIQIKRMPAASGRTAGTTASVQEALRALHEQQTREPITQVRFDSLFKDED